MTSITPFRGQPQLIRLRESEFPVIDQDRLKEASTTRIVAETTGVGGLVGGACTLLALTPPVGAIVGGALGTACATGWAVSRYSSNSSIASYRASIDRFHTFQNMIASSTAEEINPIRADIRVEISRTGTRELRLLCLAADVIALKTQVDLYKRQLSGGIAAQSAKNVTNTHPATRLLDAVRQYAESRRRADRSNCLQEARDLAGHLLAADYQAVERASDALFATRADFDRGDLVEMYYNLRRLIFSKLSQQLRTHAFSTQEATHDPFVEEDDIQF